MSDDERAIRNLVEMWMEATRSADIETVLDLMSDDAMFMSPGREPFGKQQFREQSAGMATVQMDGRADVLEVHIDGDWAWIRNHIDLTMTSPGGEPIRRSGYTLTILRKDGDGRWRLFRDANLVS